MSSLPKIGKRTFLTLLASLALFLSVFVGVSLVQKQQELRKKAQALYSGCRNPGHYLLVHQGAPQSRYDVIKNNPDFLGVQVRYSWRELEPSKGNYDFSRIESDLAYLVAMGKKLVVQFQDREFKCTASALACADVPRYIVTDPEYTGGVVRGKNGKGWYPKIWNANVVKRYNAIFAALGARFDGHPDLEAINLEETAFPYDCAASLYDYDTDRYLDGLKSITSALASAFPNKAVIRYMNHFPCRPNYETLNELAGTVISAGAGLGGPDVKIDQPGLTAGAYRIVKERKDQTFSGYAVQWADYEWTNPRTGRTQTAEEILRFARDELGVNYLFWLNREPYWSSEVLPIVARNPTLNECAAGGPTPTTTPTKTPTPKPTSSPAPKSTNTPTSTLKQPTLTPNLTPLLLPGDIDGDGDVDIFDYNILVENFGSTSCGNIADINGDCKVDIFDYNILVENFGTFQ